MIRIYTRPKKSDDLTTLMASVETWREAIDELRKGGKGTYGDILAQYVSDPTLNGIVEITVQRGMAQIILSHFGLSS